MIVYHGSTKKFEYFNKESIMLQKLPNGINTIGFWFAKDTNAAKPFAIGTETVFEKSETEFWDNGEPKVVQVDKKVNGYIYMVNIGDPNMKIYGSNTDESFDLFMEERDKFCDYLGSKKRHITWKDNAILLNNEEANLEYRNSLIRLGYEGLILPNTKLHNVITDLYCLFSEDTIHIIDVMKQD